MTAVQTPATRAVAYEPAALARSALLAPFAAAAAGAGLETLPDWPERAWLQSRLADRHRPCNAAGLPLRLVAPARPASGALGYERRIHDHAELETREAGWHDLFNLLAWCAWPRAKAALNRCQLAAARTETGGRGRERDALTLFDENGVVVAVCDPRPVLALRAFRWRELFVEQRAAFGRTIDCVVFGHALAEKALAPWPGVVGHALVVEVEPAWFALEARSRQAALDARLAARLDDRALRTPAALDPLPVLGVPGWWPANADPAFYDDARWFRAGRRRGARDAR